MEPTYYSQWDPDGNLRKNDCGPACVKMVLASFDKHVTINTLDSELMPNSDIGTDALPLALSLQQRGVATTIWTGLDYPKPPYIALVKYSGFKRTSVQDTYFLGWHWIVVLGMSDLTVVVHDPDWWAPRRNEGDHKNYSRAEFDAAFIPYDGQKVAITWKESAIVTTAKTAKVTSDMPYLRLRAAPGGISEGGTIIGHIVDGTVIPITGEGNSKNGQLWYKTRFAPVYPNVYKEEAMTTPTAPVAPDLVGYVYAGLVYIAATDTKPPVITTHRPPIGVNIIGGDANVIKYWLDAGVKRIHITFNPDAAVKLKREHPEIDVSHRAMFYGGHLPSVAEFRDKHGYCLTEPGMKCFGANENDQIGNGGKNGEAPDEIRQRASWDAQMWKLCKDNGSVFVGGGFAMGNPNIVCESIRKAMRDYYAPLFNGGMLFNQHMYSGNDNSGISIKDRIYSTQWNMVTWENISAQVRQTWWLEERPRFYVAFCGFDCTKSAFECDETGVDNPGPFNDFGFSEDEKARWAVEWQRRNGELMPNGAAYRVNSGCLFADGDYGTWGAFAGSIRPAAQAFRLAGVY